MLARIEQPGGAPGRASPRPLDIARRCADEGWYVHPLAPGRKWPAANCARCRETSGGEPNPAYIPHTVQECRCIAAGRYCHGVLAATTDAARIEQWWGENPEFGVGVAAGPSGLLVVDLDMHQSVPPGPEEILPGLALPDDVDPADIRTGEDVLALLCRLRRAPQLTESPATLCVRTPSGGLHLWYRVSDGRQWRMNSTGKLGWQIDIRADRSYAVAPGTRTRAGQYTLLGSCGSPAALPRWLSNDLARVGLKRRVCSRPGRLPVRLPRSADQRGYIAAAVRLELAAVASCTSGRNDQINRSAYVLGQFVGAGLLDRGEVHQALTDAAQQAGVDPGERKAQDTIRRALEAGARRPRRIGGGA